MNTPQIRQQAIAEIIKKEAISDQMQLVKLLKSRFGIETNQAVVSRDLRRLGVVKREINGALIYELPANDINTELLKLAVINIQHNGFMIVVKTHPGLAAFVGDWLDQHADLEVLGCLAGENVVFVSPKSVQQIDDIYQRICIKMHFKKKVAS